MIHIYTYIKVLLKTNFPAFLFLLTWLLACLAYAYQHLILVTGNVTVSEIQSRAESLSDVTFAMVRGEEQSVLIGNRLL